MKRLKLRLDKGRSYDIVVGYDIIRRVGGLIKNLRLGRQAVVITNRIIERRYGGALCRSLKSAGYDTHVIRIHVGEKGKSFSEITKAVERLTRIDRGGGIFIAALGGGATGDLAGFLARIYKRGVPYIQIPTTLLAQVDSAIGGKTAVDLRAGKNLVGAFYQPRIVISDVKLLKTLGGRIFKSGFGEIIKYGIIKDAALFGILERNAKRLGAVSPKNRAVLEDIIYRCSRIKAGVVRKDEYDDKGIRASLNFGHTVGHALETAAGYTTLYYHGEAVAIGMIVAAQIAARMGKLGRAPLGRIIDLVRAYSLPVTISKRLKLKRIMGAQLRDKKIIHGVNRFVLPVGIGRVRIFEDIPRKLIEEVIRVRYAK